MSLKKEALQTLGATLLFLLTAGIFGFGGCMALASELRGDLGISLGWLWFIVVSCGAMRLVLRLFARPAPNTQEPGQAP